MIARFVVAACACVIASPALAAESMRCGSRLVTDGDPKVKVARLCGDPAQKDTRIVYRSGVPRRHEAIDADGRDPELLIHDRSVVEVVLDVWIYNRGPTRLMAEVVFEDGRVIEIGYLGRGY